MEERNVVDNFIPMSADEAEVCKRAFALMTRQEITPSTAYAFLAALRNGLKELGSTDPEGKATAFLFFVMMRTAQGVAAGKARR